MMLFQVKRVTEVVGALVRSGQARHGMFLPHYIASCT